MRAVPPAVSLVASEVVSLEAAVALPPPPPPPPGLIGVIVPGYPPVIQGDVRSNCDPSARTSVTTDDASKYFLFSFMASSSSRAPPVGRASNPLRPTGAGDRSHPHRCPSDLPRPGDCHPNRWR